MLRIGRVSSTDTTRHSARVRFLDKDGDAPEPMESDDLPVLVTRTGDYSLPPVDGLVLCLIDPGPFGVGYVVGQLYSDADPAPLDDAGQRAIAGDDLRLGAADATDKVALAPATKTEIQKVLDYAKGIKTALQAGVPVANDGGAGLKTSVLAAWPAPPTLAEPGAEKVSAK